jgi:hypothetical protein
MPTNTYVALDTKTIGTAVSSITFTPIPSGYTDLVMVINGATASDGSYRFQFNGDTGSNYSGTLLYGNGTNALSLRGSNETSAPGGRSGTSNSTSIIQFMNYANTNTFKTLIARGNNPGAILTAQVSLWRNTSAITSILISSEGGNLQVGSTFTIYGIKAVQVYTPSTIPSSLNIGDQIYIAYSGSATTLAIPAGVNTCQLEVFGAAGGTAQGSTANGKGGYARGVYTLGGGATTVYAYVGGQGASRTASTGSGTLAGGFNGGGNGFWASNTTNQGYASSGGGGGTDFRIGGTALANRVIVAGGGGGEGGGTGGNGQFSTGGNGEPASAGQPFSAQGGFGGTQLAGGAGGGASSAGNSSAGNAGSLGVGGDGGPNRTYGQGGGGGGGYYGGGGGGTCGNGSGAGGGGGSSFVGSLALSATLNGINNGNGYAIFTKVS